jgi:hypothetical protein
MANSSARALEKAGSLAASEGASTSSARPGSMLDAGG